MKTTSTWPAADGGADKPDCSDEAVTPDDPSDAAVTSVEILTPRAVVNELFRFATLPTISTGFSLLDEKLCGGLRPTQSYSLSAPTGVGKSSLGSQIAAHNAASSPSLIWTAEMHPVAMLARVAAQICGHPSLAIQRAEIPGMGPEALYQLIPPHLRWYAGASVDGFERALKQLADETGEAPLVVLDYIQKIAQSVSVGSGVDARMGVSVVSEDVRSLAMAERCTVLAISSTSRAGARRVMAARDTSPGDLVDVGKESGAIEFDAAGVFALSLDEDEQTAVLTLAKMRDGSKGQIEFNYDGPTGKFTELGLVTPKRDRDRDDLRREILEVVDATAEPPSRNDIVKLVSRNRKATLTEIRAMLADRWLVEGCGKIARGPNAP